MAYTTINKPNQYFNTKLYTGTSATNSVTGVGFQPDWVWIKDRDRVTYHFLFNAISGATKWLASNTTGAEQTFSDTLTSFNSDGFTLGVNGDVNGSPYNFVSWNWLGANTTASNTQGSITSTVSANTTSGFSIVSYTGNATAGATVGHGLGVAPSMIIVKQRDTTGNWFVYHASIGNNGYIMLNLTDAKDQPNSTVWNNTSPTSSLFSLGTSGGVNGSGGTYIAYCFAEVKGYSKFSSYTGNGSTDGPFIYTGFKPAFLLIKRTDAAFGWFIFDNKRNTYNVASNYLLPYATDAEASLTTLDILSNGFKIRQSLSYINASGGTYIYMAFAENPFVSSTLIPTTAR